MSDLNLTLLVWALRATVVLAFAGALVALLRRSPASMRHDCWALGLAAALAVPVVAVCCPGLNWIPPGSADLVAAAVAPSESSASEALIDAPAASAVVADSAPPEAIPPRESATSPSVPARGGGGGWVVRATPWAGLAAWSVGFVVMLVPLVRGALALARLRRRCPVSEDPGLSDVLRVSARELGVGRLPKVLVGSCIDMPMCVGFWRPVVMLPAEAPGWDRDRLESVVRHELAHLRRQDLRTQWLACVARAVFWFHPLVWIAHRQMMRLREQACDDLVLAGGRDPAGYARHLLDLASGVRVAPTLNIVGIAMARPSTLEVRLRSILDPGVNRRRVGRPARLLLVSVVAATTVLVAASGVRGAAEPDLAELSSDELIALVLEAYERNLAATASLTDFHFVAYWEEQRPGEEQAWEPWGPRTRLNAWASDAKARRFRMDFLPQIAEWFNGAAPLNETRSTYSWDGERFAKVDYIYSPAEEQYGARISWEDTSLPERFSSNYTRHAVLNRLLVNDNYPILLHLRGLIDSEQVNAEATLGEQGIELIIRLTQFPDDYQRLVFSPEHDFRVVSEERGSDAAPEHAMVLYQITSWQWVDGVPYAVPAAWTAPSTYPQDGARLPGRTLHTLQGFAWIDEEMADAAVSIGDVPLNERGIDPGRRDAVFYGKESEWRGGAP
ncbi:MAG: M56 family metallopeptidase [Planctomycetota bacterium]